MTIICAISLIYSLSVSRKYSYLLVNTEEGKFKVSSLETTPPPNKTKAEQAAVAIDTADVEVRKKHGIIMMAYFRFATDPRKKNDAAAKEKPTFETIYHFWHSVVHNKLEAIIFHDEAAFGDAFVEKYSRSPYITFQKVDTDNHNNTNPNDFRYTVFANYLQNHGRHSWYLISDSDMIFNRNPFEAFDRYSRTENITYFGSYDGGVWNKLAQGLQFRQCYGEVLTRSFDTKQWNTPNGNCGLWAGRYEPTQCILECMQEQFNQPPVYGRGNDMPCDMAVHDYCVFYGGCFTNTTKEQYSDIPISGVSWGPSTHFTKLFGPTVYETAQQMSCISDDWTVSHYRCGKRQKWPICYNHSNMHLEDQPLSKYLQVGYPNNKRCYLDSETDLPLPNK